MLIQTFLPSTNKDKKLIKKLQRNYHRIIALVANARLKEKDEKSQRLLRIIDMSCTKLYKTEHNKNKNPTLLIFPAYFHNKGLYFKHISKI